MKNRKSLLIPILISVCACSGGPEKTSIGENYVGVWKATSKTCGGNTITRNGIDEFFALQPGAGMILTQGSSCYSQGQGLGVRTDGHWIHLSGGTRSCSSGGCQIPYIEKSGGSSTTAEMNCIHDVPMKTSMSFQFLGGNRLVSKENGCVTFYEHTGSTLATVPCLSTFPASRTLGSSITLEGNGFSRTGMQFQVEEEKVLKALQIIMTSPNLEILQVAIYEDGGAPEAGTIVGAGSQRDALGWVKPGLHVVDFLAPVTLQPGKDYFVVINGWGSVNQPTPFSISTNTEGKILNGKRWYMEGSTWKVSGGILNLSIGFIFHESCQ